MSDVQIIRELMNSARARPRVEIEELSDDSQDDSKLDLDNDTKTKFDEDEDDNTKTFKLPISKDQKSEGFDEVSKHEESRHDRDEDDDVDDATKNAHDLPRTGNYHEHDADADADADDKVGRDVEDQSHDDDDMADEHDFLLDMDEQRASLENLGTLLSAFFQDDRGLNVVDAIVQNSKVQNKICKTLERILDQLERA